MTELETIDQLCKLICDNCSAMPDGYCPSECALLEKARRIPFEKLQKKYIEYECDLYTLIRYIRHYKL